MQRLQLVLILIFFCLLSACEADTETFTAIATPEEVGVPQDHYSFIEWLPDDRLLLSVYSKDQIAPNSPWQYFVLDDEFREFVLPTNPLCQRRTDYLHPNILPDGRLGFTQSCIGRWPELAPGYDSTSYFVAYDLDTGEVEQIVSEPAIDLVGRSSWNPDMSLGIAEAGSLLATIYWITPSSVMPMTVTISGGSRPWSLAENYQVMQEDSSRRDIGIAKEPAWSRDGETIAFFASPDAIDQEGQSRAASEFKLYVMRSDVLQPEAVLSDLYFAHLLAWSPDDRWLLLYAEAGTERTNGLWLFSPEHHTLQLVAAGRFSDMSWAPDGHAIAAVHCLDDLCEQAEIVRYDVRSLVQFNP
jgi:hypothetical protein